MALTGPYDMTGATDGDIAKALLAASPMAVGINPAAPPVLNVGVDQGYATPEMIAAQRKRAAEMQKAGADFSPVQHWTQGLGRLASGFLGGMEARDAAAAQKKSQEIDNAAIASAMAGETPNYKALLASPSLRGSALTMMAQDAKDKRTAEREDARWTAQADREAQRRTEDQAFRQQQLAEQIAARKEMAAAAREGRAPTVVETGDGIFTLKPDGTLGNRLGAPKRAAGSEAEKPPAGYRFVMGEDGQRNLQAIPGGPADADSKASTKPLTQDERKVAGFANRMLESEKILDELEAKGVHTGNARTIAAGNIAGNAIMTPEQQQYYQAASNWVRANLRKESGAVIGKDEMDKEIANYFPKPGDKDAVIAQKREMRERVARGLANESGRAYAQFGEIPEAPSAVRRRMAEERAKAAGAPQAVPQAPLDAGPKRIGSQQEWAALPPGTRYVAPDGSTRIKK